MIADHETRLSKLYVECGVPVDQLPYTPDFDRIHQELIAATGQVYTQNHVWKTLVHMRKSGRLPKIRRAKKTESLFPES